MSYLFTSESVSEGHPDKICDQVSDALLDEALKQDPYSRVAIETFTTTGLILVGGEVTTNGWLDTQKIVRNVLKDIGYTKSEYGIAASDCNVMSAIHEQSPDIAVGVNKSSGLHKGLGAGDQGIMFGYACNQTDTLMPLPIYYAHKLMQKCAELRKSKTLPYLRPDAKAQITINYENNIPKHVDTIVISTQHNPEVTHEQISADINKHLISNVMPENLLDEKTKILINPTGRFVIGGPHGDAGLTGRKIIVDTYGGWAPHGGGAFSGKDATKVDRSATYMARYIAKNLVAANICDEILIQLSYAIGVPEPTSIYVDTKGTSSLSNEKIINIINKVFDLTPEGIINSLDLRKPVFKKVAAYGHFGREDVNASWEKVDKVEEIISIHKSLLSYKT